MTKRQAIMILIAHAAKNAIGGGLGYHAVPSAPELEKLAQAIEKVWPEAYVIPWFNLGIKPPKEQANDRS